MVAADMREVCQKSLKKEWRAYFMDSPLCHSWWNEYMIFDNENK